MAPPYNTPIAGATIFGGFPGNAYPQNYAQLVNKPPAVRSIQTPPNIVAQSGSFTAYKAGLPSFASVWETRHGTLPANAPSGKRR